MLSVDMSESAKCCCALAPEESSPDRWQLPSHMQSAFSSSSPCGGVLAPHGVDGQVQTHRELGGCAHSGSGLSLISRSARKTAVGLRQLPCRRGKADLRHHRAQVEQWGPLCVVKQSLSVQQMPGGWREKHGFQASPPCPKISCPGWSRDGLEPESHRVTSHLPVLPL